MLVKSALTVKLLEMALDDLHPYDELTESSNGMMLNAGDATKIREIFDWIWDNERN